MSWNSLIELPILKEAIANAVEDGRKWGQTFMDDPKWHGDHDSMANHAIYESTLWSLGNGMGNGVLGLAGIPTDIAINLYSQIKLSAALFAIQNVPTNPNSMPLILAAAAGISLAELANHLGANVAQQTMEKLLMSLPSKAFTEINRVLGIKLISKTGEKTLLNVTKVLPLVSSIASGTVNAVMMNACGHSMLNFIKTWQAESMR